jgi:F-type H+-transporting ATPase subunit epsilon
MQFELITLRGVKYQAQAFSVTLPTADGQITVLGEHEPLMGVLVPGIISIRRDAKDPDYRMEHYATYGGVLEITKNRARVLVDEADNGDEINQAEAEKAHATAQKMLESAKTQVEITEAEAMVNRQRVKLQVSEIRRRHQSRRQG